MFTYLRNLITNNFKYLRDLVRISILVAISVLLFYPDMSNVAIIKYVFAFLVVSAIITHVIRRILFPYVDLQQYTKKSLEHPLASSIVVFSMMMVISVVIFVISKFFTIP